MIMKQIISSNFSVSNPKRGLALKRTVLAASPPNFSVNSSIMPGKVVSVELVPLSTVGSEEHFNGCKRRTCE